MDIIINGNGVLSKQCLSSVLNLSYRNINPILVSNDASDIIISRAYPIRWCREHPERGAYSITIDGNHVFTDKDAVSKILNGEPINEFIERRIKKVISIPIISKSRAHARNLHIHKLLRGRR